MAKARGVLGDERTTWPSGWRYWLSERRGDMGSRFQTCEQIEARRGGFYTRVQQKSQSETKAIMKILKAMKLTIAEKRARGTHQAVRDRIRPLPAIQAEISEVIESLDDMQYNLREAGRMIFVEGILIDVVTRNSAGLEVRTKKLNPACRLQRDMLSAIKSTKRALLILREEEELALQLEKPVDPDFEGLD